MTANKRGGTPACKQRRQDTSKAVLVVERPVRAHPPTMDERAVASLDHFTTARTRNGNSKRLVEAMARHKGIAYLRTTRNATPVIYDNQEQFPIGGCKVLRQSSEDQATVVAAGITVYEALEAYERLLAEEIRIRVIDLYSVKPVDEQTLREAAEATGHIVTVEDHYAEGGLSDAVRTALAGTPVAVRSLAVRKRPRSGTSRELLDEQGISARAVVEEVKAIVGSTLSAASAPSNRSIGPT